MTRICNQFLAQNNINVLPWPDLSPIEHLWDELDKRVHRHPQQPESMDQLRTALLEDWNNIPQARIQRLIASMRHRLTAVIQTRGGHTLY